MSRAEALRAARARWRERARAHWQGMGVRERRMTQLAAAVVALALCWAVLLAPALRTLRGAEAQRAQLDAQLAHMRTLQAQAQALQQRAHLDEAESARMLSALSTQWLGAESIQIQGHQATATLRDVAPEKLAQWLTQARSLAHALPAQAQLQRSAAGWSGSVVLQLPAAELATP